MSLISFIICTKYATVYVQHVLRHHHKKIKLHLSKLTNIMWSVTVASLLVLYASYLKKPL